MDWNEDGILDIIVGARDGRIDFYRAVSASNGIPTLTFDGHVKAGAAEIDVGYNSAPVVVDWNEDGLLDLVVGSEGVSTETTPTLRLYLNSGSTGNPVFSSYSWLECGGDEITYWRVNPDVIDANCDGKKDLLLGERYGFVHFFENVGTNAAPLFSSVVELMYNGGSSIIDVGYTSRSYSADYNDDGVLDLLVGNSTGNVIWFIGLGTGIEEQYGSGLESSVTFSIAGSPTTAHLMLNIGMAEPASAEVAIYEASGRRIETISLENLGAGTQCVPVDLGGHPSGVYIVVLRTGNRLLTDRVVLVR